MRRYAVGKNMRWIIILVILIFIMPGCASIMEDEASKRPDPHQEWKDLAKESRGYTPSPETYEVDVETKMEGKAIVVEQQISEETKTPEPKYVKPLPKVKVSMKMHEVPIAVLLRTLARAAEVNIMINESVSGTAKINIKNVPWDDAFKGLLSTYGLTYSWNNEVLRVISIEDLNKDISLMEAQQKFEKSKKEHQIAMLAMKSEEAHLEPLLTRIVRVDYANLESMQANLERYLLASLKDAQKKQRGKSDDKDEPEPELRGSILMDPNTNSLIIQATRTDLDKIMPIIKELDKPSEQILIEAHIIEANKDTAKELGIVWGGYAINNAGGYNNVIGGPIVPTDAGSVSPSIGDIASFPIDAVTDGSGAFQLGLMYENVGKNILYAELQALEEEGDLRILSTPSITTMDNRVAIIESGQEVPFQTIEDGEVKIEFKKAVIKLEVTPHVIDKKILRLNINTHKDELDWTQTVLGNPTIITKNATTEVTLYDGQTTVIGGLTKEKISEGESGIPWLKDIKGLGWLFRSTNDASEFEDLMIFITPHILKEKASIAQGENR